LGVGGNNSRKKEKVNSNIRSEGGKNQNNLKKKKLMKWAKWPLVHDGEKRI